MAEPKTKPTKEGVKDFLNKVEPEQKRQDGFALLEMFEEVTGEKAVMWGTSIVGFGQYHYKSERSRQDGDWMLVGFSPRKQNLSSTNLFTISWAWGHFAREIGLLSELEAITLDQKVYEHSRQAKVIEFLVLKSWPYSTPCGLTRLHRPIVKAIPAPISRTRPLKAEGGNQYCRIPINNPAFTNQNEAHTMLVFPRGGPLLKRGTIQKATPIARGRHPLKAVVPFDKQRLSKCPTG